MPRRKPLHKRVNMPVIPREVFEEVFNTVTDHYDVTGESKQVAWDVALENYSKASHIYWTIANSLKKDTPMAKEAS